MIQNISMFFQIRFTQRRNYFYKRMKKDGQADINSNTNYTLSKPMTESSPVSLPWSGHA